MLNGLPPNPAAEGLHKAHSNDPIHYKTYFINQ